MSYRRQILTLSTAVVLSLSLAAQERSYWVGNLNSPDIMEVTPWGKVLQRHDISVHGTGVRQAKTNPQSGLTWVLVKSSPTILLHDSTGQVGPTITFSQGTSTFDIAFDKLGHAWVTGTGGVVEYDFVGNELNQYPIATPNKRGITIDSLGNKWIAHREFLGAVTRIDPTGVVTTFPVTGQRPESIVADFRGVGVPSRIWVGCADLGQILELDEFGTELNKYTVAPDVDNLTVDGNGFVWVEDNDLYQINPATGAVVNTYSVVSPASGFSGVNGVGVDTLGRILVAQQINFGPPQPQVPFPGFCEVQRIDPATGTIEVSTQLTIGGFDAFGTAQPPSTPFQYAQVVDPLGDVDGDGDDNLTEIQNGTSPVDPLSDSEFSLDTTGNSGVGGTTFINVRQAAGPTIWLVGLSADLLPAPVPVPGFTGNLLISPATLFYSFAGIGSGSAPVNLTGVPAGTTVYMQAIYLDALGSFNWRELSGISVW